ncbi:flavin-containing monooxygenase [Ornithinimicrobium pekingense]|uniref:Monooxygenase n=1 Tax=Ornithinimicrobium pekingense TaxID=384677 RepID=A0ABQ2F7N7_9MICO|nr:monooxygenase [Ornithinimicrobium pekingense]
MDEVLVIGSGPAGLSCAAEVNARGIPATVLEKGSDVAAAWASRYDSLRFNTSRIHSALPGAPFPRAWGQFPTRDQYVGYLRAYARRHRVPVRTGVEVRRLDPVPEGWSVRTSGGTLATRQVVVATGLANRPVLPAWARDPSAFGGTLLHSADYRCPAPFAGAEVVVVGAGSTGLEIAHELARDGAARVTLSVRTPPTVLLRRMGGLPADLPTPLFLHLPTRLVDRMLAAMSRRVVGNLTEHGLPQPVQGAISALMSRGAGTAMVDREVVDALRAGAFTVVPEAVGLEQDGVRLRDGRTVGADVVIAATGFDRGLEPLVGHLGVLGDLGMPLVRTGQESLPGLRFVGYVFRPGITGYAGRQARRAAAGVAARARAARRAPAGSTPPAWRTPPSRDRAESRR